MTVGELLATLDKISESMGITMEEMLNTDIAIHFNVEDDSTIVEDIRVGYYESKFKDRGNLIVLCPKEITNRETILNPVSKMLN